VLHLPNNIICGLDGEVKWWTESEAQPGGYYQHICGLIDVPDGGTGKLLRLQVPYCVMRLIFFEGLKNQVSTFCMSVDGFHNFWSTFVSLAHDSKICSESRL
jgi:hypothetical protein